MFSVQYPVVIFFVNAMPLLAYNLKAGVARKVLKIEIRSIETSRSLFDKREDRFILTLDSWITFTRPNNLR
jgi:hypothetical protein